MTSAAADVISVPSVNDSKITEFEMIDTKNSSTAYVVMYKLIM